MKEQHGTSHGPDRYAVVGSPVAHSLSPVIHGLFAAQTGEDIVYDKVEVSADQFQAFVMEFASGGGCGLNVTVPFKELAHDLCHQLDVSAATAGAVNTLVLNGEHWTGYNTDGIGLVNDLCVRHGQTLHNRRILLLGAGGAARGVLGPLLDKAPAQLWIVNRTASRAEELARHFTNQAAAGGTHLLGIGL
ncbi:MAG: shikimate dehydrogenase, partial [Pseudomonadota bacterium]